MYLRKFYHGNYYRLWIHLLSNIAKNLNITFVVMHKWNVYTSFFAYNFVSNFSNAVQIFDQFSECSRYIVPHCVYYTIQWYHRKWYHSRTYSRSRPNSWDWRRIYRSLLYPRYKIAPICIIWLFFYRIVWIRVNLGKFMLRFYYCNYWKHFFWSLGISIIIFNTFITIKFLFFDFTVTAPTTTTIAPTTGKYSDLVLRKWKLASNISKI